MLPHLVRDNFAFSASPLLQSQDYDEASVLLNNNLGESRLISPLRSHSRADIEFSLGMLPDIKLFAARWGDAVSVHSAPLSCWHGILPLEGAVCCSQGGHSAAAGDLLLFAPGHKIDITWHDNTRAIVLALKSSLLRDHLESQYQSDLPTLRERVMTIGYEHPAMASLGHLLQLTNAELRQGGCLLTLPKAQRQIQSLFCESLLQLVPALRALPERSILPGMLKRAVDYIHGHLDQPLNIEDLVQVSGASRRSLEQVFRHSLQTSPMRYIQQCRLNAARECLRRAHLGELQLTDLAFRFGFSQPSHFTTAYKQAFGELPSETLARN